MTAGEAETVPPYSIRSRRLHVRCWNPSDAHLLKEAVDDSLDHLRPWMPWAHLEPLPVEAKAQTLRRFRGQFDLGQDFIYGVFSSDDSMVLGGAGLHTRSGPRSLEIGYWVRASHVRQGIASELVCMLAKVGFIHCAIERLDIRVDPQNIPSLGVPRKLGFVEEGTNRRRLPALGDDQPLRDMTMFSMTVEEFHASDIAAFELESFDCMGQPLKA